MTEMDPWERVARLATWKLFVSLVNDLEATARPVADTVYWGHDLDPEQVEAMRQIVYDLEYATEEVFARLCKDCEPWEDDGERTASWVPAEPTEEDGRRPPRGVFQQRMAPLSGQFPEEEEQ